MLALPGPVTRLCEGPTRREWLRAGGLGAFGLALPDLLRARAAPSPLTPLPRGARGKGEGDGVFGRAKACIVLFLFGAPAHQDVWDLKPDAPSGVRGEFHPIATTVPGVLVGEHVPRTARQAHRFALVRSVTHPDNTHTVAMHYMLTGTRHAEPDTNPQNKPTDFPTFGAVLRKLRPGRGPLPSGVSLNAPANQVSASNHIFPGFFAGFLGGAYDPLFVSQDPSKPDFRPFPSLDAASIDRYRGRRSLLDEVEGQRRSLTETPPGRTRDVHYDRAFDLITSPAARRAFDLAREGDRTRERYGPSQFGQGCLLARRLVEAGVPLVTVNWARDDAFWDTHSDNFNLLKKSLLPPFDVAFAALLEDLDQRGLLDETLVVCLGEFGRTPQINKAAGRDHWAACNTVVLAGGGVRGGQVYGASDRTAAYPSTSPVTPQDLSATIYHALGIDIHTELRDSLGRPLPLTTGSPVRALFA